MQRILIALVVLLLASCSALVAQDASNGLKVQPDKDNVLAGSLVGSWVLDGQLNKRLGKRGGRPHLTFVADADVLQGVPAPIAKKLSAFRIYLAGHLMIGDQKHAFLVTTIAGNPSIVWFRERGGNPMGDVESWHASLARAEVPQADLLFVGGDSNNQSFAAYKRESKDAGKLTAAAAIADMTRLLVGGDVRQFVTTYVSPDDLRKTVDKGRSLDSLVERFEGPRGKRLLEALLVVSKVTPAVSEDGDLVTWQIDLEDLPPQLRLQRIDGRWYLRNR